MAHTEALEYRDTILASLEEALKTVRNSGYYIGAENVKSLTAILEDSISETRGSFQRWQREADESDEMAAAAERSFMNLAYQRSAL